MIVSSLPQRLQNLDRCSENYTASRNPLGVLVYVCTEDVRWLMDTGNDPVLGPYTDSVLALHAHLPLRAR
jgi:hypothetical protein